MPANIPPVVSLGIPPSAGTLAWAFLGEGVAVAAVAGGVLTLAGVAPAVLGRSGRAMVADVRRSALEPVSEAAPAR